MTEEEMTGKLVQHLQSLLAPMVSAQSVVPTARIRDELGLDSIGLIGLLFFIEEELSVDMQPFAAAMADSETVVDVARVALRALARGAVS